MFFQSIGLVLQFIISIYVKEMWIKSMILLIIFIISMISLYYLDCFISPLDDNNRKLHTVSEEKLIN